MNMRYNNDFGADHTVTVAMYHVFTGSPFVSAFCWNIDSASTPQPYSRCLSRLCSIVVHAYDDLVTTYVDFRSMGTGRQ